MRDMNAELGLNSNSVPDQADLERATESLVNARRNLMTGLWAGHVLGYRGKQLSIYALDVMRSDYRQPGWADVVGKVHRDFSLRGIHVTAADVERRVAADQRAAWRMFAAAD